MRILTLAPLVLALPATALAQAAPTPDEVAARTTSALKSETPGTDEPVQLGAELGTAFTRGNTETFNISGSVRLVVVLGERWVSESRARALYQSSVGLVTANNWGVFQRFDRFLSERLSLFAAAGLERDPFAGIGSRTSAQLGTSFLAIQARDPSRNDLVTDKLQLEVGAYAAYEDLTLPPNAAPDVVLTESSREIYAARGALGYVHSFSDRSQAGADVEVIQDFKDTQNTVVNESAYVIAGITQGVALKVTLIHRFDNQPADEGLKKNDFQLTAGVVVSI